MVLGSHASSPALPSAAGFSGHYGLPARNALETSCGSRPVTPSLAVQTLHSSEEGHRETSSDSRRQRPERLRVMPPLQDAHASGCEAPASLGVLHSVPGSPGRILARSHSSCETPFLGFPLPGDGVLVPGTPIRAQHRPQNLHQVDHSGGSGHISAGDFRPRIPRRYPCRSSLRLALRRSSKDRPGDSVEPRLGSQLEEVPAPTVPVVSMVGTTLGSLPLPVLADRPDTSGSYHS